MYKGENYENLNKLKALKRWMANLTGCRHWVTDLVYTIANNNNNNNTKFI